MKKRLLEMLKVLRFSWTDEQLKVIKNHFDNRLKNSDRQKLGRDIVNKIHKSQESMVSHSIFK